MKRIRYAILLLPTVLLFMAGCQGDMGMQRDDRVDDMRAVYEELARVYENLRATFYAPVETGPATGFTAAGYMLAGYCDEAQEVAQSSPVYEWYDGRVSSTQMPLWRNKEGDATYLWQGLYSAIFSCNSALMYLDDKTLVTDYEPEKLPVLKAQFFAVRAYCYLQLAKRWGGVPIFEGVMDKNYDYSKVRRASFAQVVDYIIESCDQALATDPSLPWFSGTFSYSNPMIARTAIWAIKSQAALYAASPLWAGDSEGTQPYTWERAAKITKTALDACLSHGARLIGPHTTFPAESSPGLNPYDKYFLASYPFTLDWDTETLYQPYHYDYKRCIAWQYAGLPTVAGQVSAGACPTQELVDAYEVVSPDGTRAVPLLDLERPYNDDGTPNINPEAQALGYQDCSDKMYLNRDPRFYATIYHDGTEIELSEGPFEIETRIGGNCALNLSPTNKRYTCTGYYLRKFRNPLSNVDDGNRDGFLRAFRLAELYLNFAEAAYMWQGADAILPPSEITEYDSEGTATTVTVGESMSARQAVDAIRARVGMPGITDNGEAFYLRLRNERRVELAFEEHRFFDVRRWTTPDGDLSATDRRVHGIRIESRNGVKVYERFAFERNCYSNKFLRYPIDLDEVRKMLHHSGVNWQNPGWN